MKLYADSIAIGLCPDPHCKCVHIDLLDGEEVIAGCVVPLNEIESMVSTFQALAYRLATGEK